jgi:hypothetical protein
MYRPVEIVRWSDAYSTDVAIDLARGRLRPWLRHHMIVKFSYVSSFDHSPIAASGHIGVIAARP